MFLTLTYAPEYLVYDIATREKTLVKRHAQLFFKKLRKADNAKQKTKIKYFLVGEYGPQTLHPHYHVILYNCHNDLRKNLTDIWGHGHVDIGDVTAGSIAYCTGYIINAEQGPSVRRFPLALMSKGLGKEYLTTSMIRWHKSGKRNYTQVNGQIGPLPRYYKDKIFNKHEKEILNVITLAKHEDDYKAIIERLERLHPDPESLYLEMIDNKYIQTKNKATKQHHEKSKI